MKIDQAKCVKCGTCKNNCPLQAIELRDGQYIIDETKCCHCGTCAVWCPGNAITE